MNRNKIIGVVITVVAVVAIGTFLWQNHQQKAVSEQGSQEIIADNRTQVTNQDDPKYKSTVLINSTEKESEFGTGYVIGKNTVATNRHVVKEVKNHPEKAVVRVGHKDEKGKVSFKEFKIKEILMPKDKSLDVALLKLEPKNGKTVSDYRDIAKFGDAGKVKEGTKLTLVGYPGDKDYATMWAGTGEVDMVNGNMISFKVVSAPGNSGSPLFDKDGKVVAMNNAGGDNNSFGFLIDKAIRDFFEKNMD